MQNKTAIIIGATGLIGSLLTDNLLKNSVYSKVVVLVRNKIPTLNPKLEQLIYDFDNFSTALPFAEDVYCCIGTTIKKAGSEQAQYRIDCTIPFEIAKIAKQNGANQFLLVSSVGANSDSNNFYLKTKGEVEQKLASLQFKTFISVRPSMLYGNRKEFRLGEKIGIVFAKLVAPIMLGNLKKFAGIEASSVANALYQLSQKGYFGNHFVESNELQQY